MFDTDRILQAANADPQFRIAARFWNATLRIDVGDQPYVLELRDGRIARFAPRAPEGAAKQSCDLRIFAPVEEWRQFLVPIPRPFYQDLYAAMWRQGIKMEGDLTAFYPYYAALNRVFEIMRGLAGR